MVVATPFFVSSRELWLVTTSVVAAVVPVLNELADVASWLTVKVSDEAAAPDWAETDTLVESDELAVTAFHDVLGMRMSPVIAFAAVANVVNFVLRLWKAEMALCSSV